MFFGRVNSFELALFYFNATGSVATKKYFCIKLKSYQTGLLKNVKFAKFYNPVKLWLKKQ
jgi:hypothetical protein